MGKCLGSRLWAAFPWWPMSMTTAFYVGLPVMGARTGSQIWGLFGAYRLGIVRRFCGTIP